MIRYMRAVLTASSVTNNTHMPSSISDSSHWNRTLVGCCWDRNLNDGKGDKMIFDNEIFCILEWTGLSVWLLIGCQWDRTLSDGQGDGVSMG